MVAIDPLTGGVLAMVSTPTFDPNQFVAGIDLASFKALNTSAERPLFNECSTVISASVQRQSRSSH